ncbi:hypothetical protein BDR03DRAFT_284044 [Suillus americanus]|nr:hypothetical protein BDR03DRAFT_284044 [Suillus americanus]
MPTSTVDLLQTVSQMHPPALLEFAIVLSFARILTSIQEARILDDDLRISDVIYDQLVEVLTSLIKIHVICIQR